jgi:hypothetical protein
MQISDADLEKAIVRLKAAPPPRPDASVFLPDTDARPAGATPASKLGEAYMSAVADTRASLEILNAPAARKSVLLERPAWSWMHQRDNSPLQVDIRVAANDSWVKLRHSSNSKFVNDFVYFYFYWANDTGRPALLDAYVPFVLTGNMQARAAGTFWGPQDPTYTHLNTSVRLMRNTGWGADDGKFMPFTLNQIQDKFIHANSKGRSLYRSGPSDTRHFDYQSYHSTWYGALIPSGASVFVTFIIQAYCAPNPAGRLDTLTHLEFYDGDHAVRIPYAFLTVAT